MGFFVICSCLSTSGFCCSLSALLFVLVSCWQQSCQKHLRGLNNNFWLRPKIKQKAYGANKKAEKQQLCKNFFMAPPVPKKIKQKTCGANKAHSRRR
jgi:hypothetical protein